MNVSLGDPAVVAVVIVAAAVAVIVLLLLMLLLSLLLLFLLLLYAAAVALVAVGFVLATLVCLRISWLFGLSGKRNNALGVL